MSTKDLVQEKVDEYRDRIIEISDWIYENPELGSEEFEAAELLAGELENHGFEVERNLCDMPTAFSASYKGKAGGPRWRSTTPCPASATAAATTSSPPRRSVRASPSAG